MYYNKNAGQPDAWTYEPDLSRQAINDGTWKNVEPAPDVAGHAAQQVQPVLGRAAVCLNCVIGRRLPTISPEAGGTTMGSPHRVQQITWTSPVTSRLLLEAGFGTYLSHYGGQERPGNNRDLDSASPNRRGIIPGLTYRSQDWSSNLHRESHWRASLSYVTGAHNMKVGYHRRLHLEHGHVLHQQPASRLPVQQRRAEPADDVGRPTTTAGRTCRRPRCYAQDQSTFGRLTVQGGVRYDRASSSFLDQQLGPDRFVPTVLTLPAQDGVNGYNDITPAAGRVLRPVRQRQDGHQGDRRQVCGRRDPRRLLRRHQSAQPHRDQHDADVDRRATATSWPTAICSTRWPICRRRSAAAMAQPELREERVQQHLRPGGPRRVGRPCPRLEFRCVASSSRCSPGSRSPSPTTGAGSAISSSPTISA